MPPHEDTGAPVLILGIGNILLGDEGVGVRIVEAMRGLDLPEGVEIVDGGTSGAGLVDVIAGRRKLIIVDAVQVESPPGTVVRFGEEAWGTHGEPSLSLHQIGLVETLWMARRLGCAPREVVIFGIQPDTVSPGLALSEKVRNATPKVIALLLAEAMRTMRSE